MHVTNNCLKNISEHYNIANAGAPVILEENGLFTVRLPLGAPAKILQEV